MRFEKWLDTFLEEKGIDLNETFSINGWIDNNTYVDFLDYTYVIEAIKNATKSEEEKIKNKLIRIDFMHGDIKKYLQHLAQALIK